MAEGAADPVRPDHPVQEKGELAAMMFVNDGRPRVWTDDEILFLTRIAERTRLMVERRRAEASLRASETRLRFLEPAGQKTAGAPDAESVLAETTLMLGE